MISPLLDQKSRTICHGHSTRVRRLISSRITRRPLMSGFVVFLCVLLVVLGVYSHFNKPNGINFNRLRSLLTAHCSLLIFIERLEEWIERNKAQSELVRKMMSYSLESTNVALVIPKTQSDDIRWLQKHIQTRPNITPFMYSMSTKREKDLLIPHSSRGREVSAYLSYLIDYYDQLPQVSIFIHAGKEQHHNDLFGQETKLVLENLRLEAVHAHGYTNLRCTHAPGCPSHVQPNNPSKFDIQNGDARAHFAQIYRELFGAQKAVPDSIGGACCGQFAVSRDQIRRRPKSDYVRMMEWVDKGSKLTVDNYGVGWVFEIVWHVVFSMEDVHCPVYEQCRCDNYGWCGPLASGETLTPIDKKQSASSVLQR